MPSAKLLAKRPWRLEAMARWDAVWDGVRRGVSERPQAGLTQAKGRQASLRSVEHCGSGEGCSAPLRSPRKNPRSGSVRGLSIGTENVPVIGIENVPVRRLPRGGSGATGAGQRAGNVVVMTDPLAVGMVQRLFDSRGDGWPWRAPHGGACGSCCRGC